MPKKITLNGFVHGTGEKFEGKIKDLETEDSYEEVVNGKKKTKKIIKKEEVEGYTIVYSVEVE